jgi:DNA repair exonuclease SbcCD ATPase subunit/DNA repair exonuclease SbcCD nuclease subunit
MYQYIFHISDIHIGSSGKNTSRASEYIAVFDSTITLLKKYSPQTTIVAITGDVFHFKTNYSGEDVFLFKYLLNKLNEYKVVLIPGNHDVNMKNEQSVDLISPIVDSYQNVIYHRNTAIFEVGNITFHHISMFDEIPQVSPNSHNTVLLYHGFVNGARFGTHLINDAVIKAEILKSYKLCLLGDIHESQFVLPTAAYAGSLIQQNLGESRDKGIIIWDVANNRGNFAKIANDTVLIRLDLRGKTAEECEQIIANETIPKKLLKLSVITDSTVPIQKIEEKFGKINSISQVAKVKLDPNKDVMSALGMMLESKNLTSEAKTDILTMHEKTLSVQKQNRWTIDTLEWQNILKYGSKINKIDFRLLQGGLSGVIGDNCIGKSSIIDILLYVLFADLTNSTKDTFIHYGATSSYVRAELTIGDNNYVIIRKDHRTSRKNTGVEFLRVINGEHENAAPTAASITEVNAIIQAHIGTKEQFFATSIYKAGEIDIFHADSVRRLSLLSTLFGMPDYTNVIKSVSAERKSVQDKLYNLVKPRDAESAAKLPAKHDEIRLLKEQYDLMANKRNSLAKNAIIRASRPLATIEGEIANIKRQLSTIAGTITTLSDKIEIDVPFANKVVITQQERELADANEPNSDDHQQMIQGIRNKMVGLITKAPTNPANTIANNEKEIATIVGDKRNNITYSADCPCCQKNKTIISQLVGNVALDKIKILEDANAALTKSYKTNMESYQTYMSLEKELNALLSKEKRIKDISQARDRVNLAYKYEQYMLSVGLRDANSKKCDIMQRLTTLTDELNKATIIEKEREIVSANNAKIAVVENAMNNALKRIGALQEIIAVLETDIVVKSKYDKESAILQQQYDKLKAYEECLKSHSLKIIAINKIMKTTIDSTNAILEDVSHFRLDYEVSETSMDIWIVESNGFKKPISGGSGFQKAIISLAFRLTLTTILPCAADFVIMDEPLQYSDKSHLQKVQETLLGMPLLYKFVFIISHIDELKDIIQFPLKINIIKGESHISNTDIHDNLEPIVAEVISDGKIRCEICDIILLKNSYKTHIASKGHEKKSKIVK